jgi:hypothetical protein
MPEPFDTWYAYIYAPLVAALWHFNIAGSGLTSAKLSLWAGDTYMAAYHLGEAGQALSHAWEGLYNLTGDPAKAMLYALTPRAATMSESDTFDAVWRETLKRWRKPPAV